jgi:type III pantothenate kinase
MQSGLYFGYVGLVVHTIAQIGKELGRGFHVVATGGFGSQIAAEVPAIEAYEPSLVLDGLRIVYERNQDE